MKFINRLSKWDEYGRCIMVQVDIGGHRPVEIAVSQGTSLDDFSPEPPSVNWCAIGAATPEVAELFAAGLAQAADVARLMGAVEDWKRPEHPGGSTGGATVTFDKAGGLVVDWIRTK
ncbi:MAG: hypothetical protein ACTSX8_03165 [Alphaproteobacteria bacterium]